MYSAGGRKSSTPSALESARGSARRAGESATERNTALRELPGKIEAAKKRFEAAMKTPEYRMLVEHRNLLRTIMQSDADAILNAEGEDLEKHLATAKSLAEGYGQTSMKMHSEFGFTPEDHYKQLAAMERQLEVYKMQAADITVVERRAGRP